MALLDESLSHVLGEVVARLVEANWVLESVSTRSDLDLVEAQDALKATLDELVLAQQAQAILDLRGALAAAHSGDRYPPRPIAVLVRHRQAVEEGGADPAKITSLASQLYDVGLTLASRPTWTALKPARFCNATTKNGEPCQRKAQYLADGLRADYCYQHLESGHQTSAEEDRRALADAMEELVVRRWTERPLIAGAE